MAKLTGSSKMTLTKDRATALVVAVIVCTILSAWILSWASEPFISSFNTFSSPVQSNSSSSDLPCQDQSYTTEIISLDPLVMYLHGFLNTGDIENILQVGEDRFNPSVVNQKGKMVQNLYRTSSSAVLPVKDPAVHCVLERSKKFLGTILDPHEDEMGVPQLVRYTEGQEYNLHHDWLRIPQAAFDGSARSFNRVASFFVTLQDSCTGGATWFPFIKPLSPQPENDNGRLWYEHEDGGVAFKPVAGNGIFWVNLFPNGTGDTRTVHAGLPVTGGLKTAMNIWPRQYRPSDPK